MVKILIERNRFDILLLTFCDVHQHTKRCITVAWLLLDIATKLRIPGQGNQFKECHTYTGKICANLNSHFASDLQCAHYNHSMDPDEIKKSPFIDVFTFGQVQRWLAYPKVQLMHWSYDNHISIIFYSFLFSVGFKWAVQWISSQFKLQPSYAPKGKPQTSTAWSWTLNPQLDNLQA